MRTLHPTQRPATDATDTLTLPFELRQKSRLRARLDSGEEVALFVPRGRVLRGGDHLLAEEGGLVQVRAAAEVVSRVPCADRRVLARAAYHLGNRHVAVEVGEDWLQYLHDHVLDDMVRGLGLEIRVESAPFEPETGAYAHGHSASHGHDAAPRHAHADHEHGGGAQAHGPHDHHSHEHGRARSHSALDPHADEHDPRHTHSALDQHGHQHDAPIAQGALDQHGHSHDAPIAQGALDQHGHQRDPQQTHARITLGEPPAQPQRRIRSGRRAT